MPRLPKKTEREMPIEDEKLGDSLSKPQFLPKDLMIVRRSFDDKNIEPDSVTSNHIDSTTRQFLGDGHLPKWMRNSQYKPYKEGKMRSISRKEVI
jgi:hypothetical protein